MAGAWLALALVATTTVSAEGSAPTVTPEYPVAEMAVGGAKFEQHSSSVASDGSGYLVAWSTWAAFGRTPRTDVRATLLDADGTPLDPFGFDLSNGSYSEGAPSIAWNNGVYLVVWEQQMPEWTMPCCFPDLVNDVYGARVSPDGTVLDPGGFPIAQVAGSNQQSPDVAPLGDGFVVVWEDRRADNPGIRGTRVSAGGAVVDPDGIDVSTGALDRTEPAVAANGDAALVVWTDARAGNPDVRGTRVAPDGAVLDPSSFPIATGTAEERRAAVASDGTDFLVGWEVHGTQRRDIHVSPVAGDATVLHPGGMLVAKDATEAFAPTIASAGSGYLVAWTDVELPWEVRGQHMGPDATSPHSTSFLIGASAYTLSDAAAGPGGYLVTWDDFGNRADVFAKLVPESAQPVDTDRILVSGEPNEQMAPAVAWDGTNYLVAWTDNRSGADVYASRVTPDGTSLDGTGIPVSTAHRSQSDAQVAWNGSTYLVVWIDYRSPDTGLYGARVTREGQVLDPEGIRLSPPGSSPTFDLSIASDGSGFVVAWTGHSGQPPAYGGVHATRVAADGAVLDPEPMILGRDGYRPSVAWNGRAYLVAWSTGTHEERDVHAVRIMRGRVRDSTPIVVSAAPGRQDHAQVASDGDGFFVAWTDRRSGNDDVYGARVRKNGKVLDPEGVAVVSGPEDESATGVVWNGRHYVVTWRPSIYPDQIALTRLTSDAVVVDPAGIPVGAGTSTGLAAGPPGEAASVAYRSLPDPPYNGVARGFIRFFRE